MTAVVTVLATVLLAVSPVQVKSQQKVPFRFNQGVARFDGGWILSGTNVLARTDDHLHITLERSGVLPDEWRAKGYNHVGDIDVVGSTLYAPYEQPNFDLGRQATARYDAATLRFIDAVELPQHENSFVAVDRRTNVAYTMDHFDGDSLLRYQLPAWTPLAPLHLNRLLHKTQGAAVARGSVWISTTDTGNNVYRVDSSSGAVTRVGTLGDQGEGEGIDATQLPSGSLHALRNLTGTTDVLFEHLATPHTRRAWIGWIVVGLAVVVFAWIGRWWVRNLRRQRPT